MRLTVVHCVLLLYSVGEQKIVFRIFCVQKSSGQQVAKKLAIRGSVLEYTLQVGKSVCCAV